MTVNDFYTYDSSILPSFIKLILTEVVKYDPFLPENKLEVNY